MTLQTRTNILQGFFLLSYFVVLILCLGYLDTAALVDALTLVFYLLTLVSYAMAYLLPAFVLTMVGNWLLGLFAGKAGKEKVSSLYSFVVAALAISTTSMTLIALYADRQIYNLFGFHFNSFVLNLITTSGGIESMGGSNDANLVYGLICAFLVAVQAALYWLSVRFFPKLFCRQKVQVLSR